MPLPPLEPLRFERQFVEKIWGGRSLERRLGIELPAGAPIGETWEVVDREAESSVVAGGPLEGRTLRELMTDSPREILGKAPAARDGRFPLLVKYIDAADDLSVQVHPDDEFAARLAGGAEGKTEAWYILDVAAGGALYAGLKPDVTAEDFADIADGPGVVEALLRWDVEPGDCMLVPGGTVHAIGKGVTILEVQQNSDTTYRLWDWGRVGLDGEPRETHVELALSCVAFGQPERPPMRPAYEDVGGGMRCAVLARSRHFGVNALELGAERRLPTNGQFQIYTVLDGEGTLSVDGREGRWRLGRGDVWLVPACTGYHRVAPEGDTMRILQLQYRP